MDPSIPPVLEAVTAGLKRVLGDRLVAVYLTGSAAAGDFEPGISDLDLVVVVEGDAGELDLDALSRLYAGVVADHPDWEDRLEAVHLGRATLASFRTSRGRLAVVSPGESLHVHEAAAVEWTQNWWQLRQVGRTIIGPRVEKVVPWIDADEYLDATRRYLGEVAAQDLAAAPDGSLAYAVLTACRARATLATGRPLTKRAGAQWAIGHFRDRKHIVGVALACRRSRGRSAFGDSATRTAAIEFIRELANEAARAP